MSKVPKLINPFQERTELSQSNEGKGAPSINYGINPLICILWTQMNEYEQHNTKSHSIEPYIASWVTGCRAYHLV